MPEPFRWSNWTLSYDLDDQRFRAELAADALGG
jgi:hypothetical protein